MSTLSLTYGNVATNDTLTETVWDTTFTEITNWANGSITQTNFGTMTGVVTWSIATNVLACNITNTGTEGSITAAHNGVLAAGKSAAKITSTAAQTTGDAMLYIDTTHASSTIPSIIVKTAGSSPAFRVQT